jgi:hypothetical protein
MRSLVRRYLPVLFLLALNPALSTYPSAQSGEPQGTHVAGTIVAEGNNGVGIIGVAWLFAVRQPQ